ncbi:glycosyltransferase family 4 protein [bacterium]|nr:glycosyltransferase family 4 protein [bacterium]
MNKKRSILLIYRYFYPDPVASSKHFSDLAQSLVNNGWDVYVLTGDRMRHLTGVLPEFEIWNGIKIIRSKIWTIFDHQIVNKRFINSIIKIKETIFKRFLEQYSIISSWKDRLSSNFNFNNIEFDKIFIGTDPGLSFLLFPFLKERFKNSELIYWLFDLYPDIFYKHFNIPNFLNFNRYFKYIDKVLYLDNDMKKLVEKRFLGKKLYCVTPWGFAEPDLDDYFENLPPKNINKTETLKILYSGNLGRGHSFDDFLELAKLTENDNVEYQFSAFGESWDRLKKIENPPKNIKLMSGVSYKELGDYLLKADIHLLSLKNGWEGLMLPSKLFGSMAVGKGVIFSGSQNSSISEFITTNRIGSVLNGKNSVQMAQLIKKIIKNREILFDWGKNSYQLYKKSYSKEAVTNYIHKILS